MVVYAHSKRKRLQDFLIPRNASAKQPVCDVHCPFCPGNEEMLSDIILESRGSDPLWQIRIVANKYPALTPNGNTKRERRGMYMAMNRYGHHEVIIESPLHNRPLSVMSLREVEMVIECYHRRYVELIQMDGNMMVIIFRNQGRRAGASLFHPHSQVISTGIVPPHVRSREHRASASDDEWGRCIYCDIIEEELRFRQRIVSENESFVESVRWETNQEAKNKVENHEMPYGLKHGG